MSAAPADNPLPRQSKFNHWYPRFTKDAIHARSGLTLEEKGAFDILIDWICDKDGSIPNNDRWLSGQCEVSMRKWKIIRASLIEKQAIYLTKEGTRIRATYADEILDERRQHAESYSERGRKGRAKQLAEASTGAPKAPESSAAKNDEKSLNSDNLSNKINAGARAKPENGASEWRFEPTDDTHQKLIEVAPKWDRQLLYRKYREFQEGREKPRDDQAAFLGWARKFTKGKPPD